MTATNVVSEILKERAFARINASNVIVGNVAGLSKVRLDYRTFLHLNATNGELEVTEIGLNDAGAYTCKLEYHFQPAIFTEFNLTVNAPPEKPIIYDTTGDPVNLILGPYKI